MDNSITALPQAARAAGLRPEPASPSQRSSIPNAELVQRIEAAGEGSRELDAKIALACDPEFAGWIEHPANNGNQYGEVAPSREAFDEWLIRDGAPCLISTPCYTTSIDAAETLIPPGLHWTGQRDGDGGRVSVGEADSAARGTFYTKCHHGTAKTMALALCAAALKAKGENQ